eukprot:4053201-Pleurochrysis_carterae.AAC.2
MAAQASEVARPTHRYENLFLLNPLREPTRAREAAAKMSQAKAAALEVVERGGRPCRERVCASGGRQNGMHKNGQYGM